MSNVVNFENTPKEMTRNQKLTVLLYEFFELHEVEPLDAFAILNGMICDMKDAGVH